MITLIEVAYGKTYNDLQKKLYYQVLKDIPGDIFERGIEQLIKSETSNYLPVPGKIREYCLGNKEERINKSIAVIQDRIRGRINGMVQYEKLTAYEQGFIRSHGGSYFIREWTAKEISNLINLTLRDDIKTKLSMDDADIKETFAIIADKEEGALRIEDHA